MSVYVCIKCKTNVQPVCVFSHTPVNFYFGGVFDALSVLLTDHLLVARGCAKLWHHFIGSFMSCPVFVCTDTGAL